MGNSQSISYDLPCAFGSLDFWQVGRTRLSSGLGMKNRLIEGKSWSSTLCYPGSLSQQNSQCLPKVLCRLVSTKLLSAFDGFVPSSNGFWEVPNTSQRHHCSYCLICRARLAWMIPGRLVRGNDTGSIHSVLFPAILTHPCMKWPKFACHAPQPALMPRWSPAV